MTRVFVYGSLLRGMGNHRVIERGRFVAAARTEARYRMHSLGAFPGVVAEGNVAIVGETYDVDEATLADLDRLEGHPRFYTRTRIELEDGSIVSTYLLPAERCADRPVVESGDWRTYYENERGYRPW